MKASEQKIKKMFGVKIEKFYKKDYSLGMCLTYDGFEGECYLFINAIKWTISIGLLNKN